jgi:glycosyltransferase involved in cell wall biosynthesis
VTLSVVIITYNEEANIGRTLESVKHLVADDKGEVIVVDSGSTDRTVEIARSSGAKVFIEGWKGYAAQKNSALEKASGDWILSLDADESIDSELLADLLEQPSDSLPNQQPSLTLRDPGRGAHAAAGASGFWIARKNYFLGRWIQHGGFWPDRKLRFFRRGNARFEDRLVHEDVKLEGPTGVLSGALVHNCYSTLSGYIDHMNRYSSLGARMAVRSGSRRFNLINLVLRPLATFVYNYFFRLGFLDGREGLLLHLYHAAYVSWKYAKAWELSRSK